MTKTREVKFKNHQELYSWLATGKPIRHWGVPYLFRNGRYHNVKDEVLGANASIEEYTGIEEVPVKKAYAYESTVSPGRIYWNLLDNLTIIDGHRVERLPEFDLEARE